MKRVAGTNDAKRAAVAVLAGATLLAGLLCGGAIALAGERNSVPMEVAVGGPTAEEMLTAQGNLHKWLTALMPAGTLDRKISIPITSTEAADLARSMEAREDPFKVGLVEPVQHPVSFDSLLGRPMPKSATQVAGGMFRATGGGGFSYGVTLTSDGAVGIRVHFTKVDLPDNAGLYVMNTSGQAFGPYSGRGPNGTGEFWSNTVSGDTAIVVLRHEGPGGRADLRRSSFRIEDLGHLGPAFNKKPVAFTESFCSFNASCVENASCHNGTPAESAKSAVALIQWISGRFIFTCSGGLIADSDPNTQIPYFLTANHCISSSTNASNVEAYFQFSLSCGSTNCPAQTNPGGIQRLGSTIKATGTAGDYTLLQLNQAPPSGSVFLGWNNTAIANTNNAALYRISHPAWAPQAYSQHHVDTGAPTCTGWPRGERIYSRDDVGATEGGSSGSPVVNASGQIVGQLSGACGTNVNNVCDAVNNATVDGAFAFYYNNVAPFLAGGGGGCTLLPPGASCTSNSQCCSSVCSGPKKRKTCQ